MKVCKVVINSVSHDARVLKEAEAIKETGCDVVIVGIQDANNSVPIQVMDNGVAIRRVAWQANAFRPNLWSYIWQACAGLIGISVATLLVLWVQGHHAELAHLVTFENTLYISAASAFAYLLYSLLRVYFKKRKSYLNLKKRERDEFLKYDVEFSVYLSKKVREVKERPPNDKSPKVSNTARSFSLPRPLMVGILKAFMPSNLKRWKVVLARERQVLRVLEEEAPNVVHAHDLSALPVAAKYANARGAKLLFDAHEIYDHLAQSEDELSELNGKILRKYSGEVDLFITINDSIARYYHKNYPALPPAIVIKNATKKAEAFEYDGRLHAAAGLARETRILIYQGGYAPKRGLIPLLLSAEYLDPRWSIVFMGWDKLEEELRRVAESLKMKNPELDARIRFVPRVKQSELPYWTAGASLGAIPYENTGLNHWYCNPNKLWEYPNAGVPIIASPFPELRRMIESHSIGWLLPDPLNARDIAAAVNALDDHELKEAAQNCTEFIASDNWDVYANRLKQVYSVLQ